MIKKFIRFFLLFFLLLSLCQVTLFYLRERSQVSGLTIDANETEAFRRQQLTGQLVKQLQREKISAELFPFVLASTMAKGDFSPTELSWDFDLYEKYKPREFSKLVQSYSAIWQDLEYFPLPKENVSYADTWMARRSYGKDRRHEGTDLFIENAQAGEYPVYSMTEGVVEQIGWLPLGGYRLGIRSDHGGYFYYAHLFSYWKRYEIGEEIAAGEIIGFMGNTGYGDEGTSGKFPVHLHLGIYISTENKEEQSVNPYWILRYMDE